MFSLYLIPTPAKIKPKPKNADNESITINKPSNNAGNESVIVIPPNNKDRTTNINIVTGPVHNIT